MNIVNKTKIVTAFMAVTLMLFSCKGKDDHWYDLKMTSDPILDQVLLFYLGHAWQGMSDVNECLETVGRIDKDNPDSWAIEWEKTALRLEATGREKMAAGHTLSAGEYFLRAATYYRAALHRHMYPGHPDVKRMTEKEIECFVLSQKLLEEPMEVVAVPYENIKLTGYFYTSPLAAGPAPVIIIHQGRDAWAEDCKYFAAEAMRRGYHALLIDGPGNGQALRMHNLPFRPDWEAFITPVVDYLETRAEVDEDAIMLMGLSMGGYLAPRAAAFENRLSVCIANPGVLDWGELMMETTKEHSPMIMKLYDIDPAKLDKFMVKLGEMNPFFQWVLDDFKWKHGVDSFSGWINDVQRYSTKEYVQNITSSMLIIDAEHESWGQAQELYEAVQTKKDYMMFTEKEAAPLHCQTGSLAVSCHRIFDWIDSELASKNK